MALIGLIVIILLLVPTTMEQLSVHEETVRTVGRVCVGIALLVGIVRSQRLASRIGELVQSTVESLMRRLDREPPRGLKERVMGLREMGHSLMNTAGLLGLDWRKIPHLAG